MAEVGVVEHADREVDTLSGGERQRVGLALALVQQTPILLLDEPTTYLDIRHQLEMLELVARVHTRRGLTLMMVLHDLATVVTPELLHAVFGVHARLVPDGDQELLAYDHPVGTTRG